MWEYQCKTYRLSAAPSRATAAAVLQMNEEGEEGWEAFHMRQDSLSVVVWFKRKKIDVAKAHTIL